MKADIKFYFTKIKHPFDFHIKNKCFDIKFVSFRDYFQIHSSIYSIFAKIKITKTQIV
jgi:hypothetical protein